jgi:hypothetical protein
VATATGDKNTKEKSATAAEGDTQRKVQWDDSKMESSFANVVNGSSTREEITLFFGTNQTWNVSDAQELKVQLDHRIILTPFAAKRLHLLLGAMLKSYESAYGSLDIETRTTPPKG